MLLQTRSILAAAEELALARSGPEFADSLEHLGAQIGGGPVRFFRVDPQARSLGRPGGGPDRPLDESTLPGRCVLYNEAVDGRSEEVPGLDGGLGATCLPVRRYGAAVGVLALAGPPREGLEDLARLAGVLWELVALREDQACFATRTEDLLVRAGSAVEPGAEQHVLRVSRLAGELASFMDLSARSRSLVDRAARLHDVGKVGLADRSRAERERLHPEAGADYLRSSRALADLAPLVEAHHEAWDGSGFPHGLSGDDVPVEAWVLALAEDLDEDRRPGAPPFEPWLEAFLDRRARAHHPAVLDALGGLIVSGRLQGLLA